MPQGTFSSQTADKTWETTFNSETRYFAWRSSSAFPGTLAVPNVNSGGAAVQIYTPYSIEIDGNPNDDWKIENNVRSGYVHSHQMSQAASGFYNGPVDTSISSTVTYFGIKGIQPFISMSVNAPTGTSVLLGSAANARLDTDVVDTPTFGQGWNVGPSVGVNIPFMKQLVASLSIGYLYQGPFQRESLIVFGQPQGVDRLKPGDDTTVTANLKYKSGAWRLSLSASYMTETTSTNDFVASYKSGDRVTVTGGARYKWDDHWSSNVNATFTHQQRNKIVMAGLPDLVAEAFNSNSNVTTVKVDTTYSDGPLSVGPVGSFMFRDNNAYNPISATFLPQKTKWTAGAAASYDVNKQINFNARVERMWLHEDINPGDPAFGGSPAIQSRAWLLILGGTAVF